MAPLAVVTGANAGIGLEVTAGLRQAGYNVLMACRNPSRCNAAKAELDSRGLPGSCECAQLDLADYASIRSFADQLSASGRQLTTLVNNAGIMGVGPAASGENGHMQANHYGPFLLTRLLLPLMSAGGRVVTVGSQAHRRTPARRVHDMDRGAGYWLERYGASKLCNLLMTAELSRRLMQRGSSVTACTVSPGRVNTNIFQNIPGLLRRPVELLAGLVFQTPQQGARTVLRAAVAPELAGQHVLYMHAEKEAQPTAVARDPQLAADLWQRSVEAVGLTPEEDACLWPRQ